MRLFHLILLLLLFFLLCPDTAQDKQAARIGLHRMDAPFTTNAFILSIVEGDKAKVELFLAAGMNPNAIYTGEQMVVAPRVVTDGQTALQVALAFDRMDLVRLLLARGANVYQPANYGSLLEADGPLVKVLLDNGINVNEGIAGGYAALWGAAHNGDARKVALLLDYGAEVNQRAADGQTALMAAAWSGDVETLALLLDHAADVNAKSQRGDSALRIAAACGQRAAVKLLVEHGADLSEFSDRAIRMMTQEPDQGDQVMQLIGRLYIRRSGYSITGPSLEDQRQVPARLLEIASESAGSRAAVIERMIDVVEDPAAKDGGDFATAWVTAVETLGKLKAAEAIDVLIENLGRTGQNGVVLSIHFKPVSRALERIGEPAVPKLIEALAHSKPVIKWEAAWVLFSIDEARARAALESACRTEKDAEIRQAFRDVIKRIEQGY